MGGAEAVLCDLIKGLGTERFMHTVIYFHEGPYVQELHALGIKTYRIDGLLFRYDPIFFIRLWWLLKRLKPDCLHSLLWAANTVGRLMAWFMRIPAVSVLHNNVDQDGIVRNCIDRITMLCADAIVAVSPGVAQSLLQRDSWIPARRVQVICNGIDIEKVHAQGIRYQKNRYELGLSEEHFIIGAVGRFHPVKNYGLLLESFAIVTSMHPLARLIIVGTGSEYTPLKDYAAQLGIDQSVTFIIDQQAYGYYPLFNCFASASDKEGVSLALLEALSFGLPCVVTNSTSDHPVLHSSAAGIVVPAGDAQALAQGILRIIHDESLRKRLQQAARRVVEHNFTVEQMVQSYQKLFVDIGTWDHSL